MATTVLRCWVGGRLLEESREERENDDMHPQCHRLRLALVFQSPLLPIKIPLGLNAPLLRHAYFIAVSHFCRLCTNHSKVRGALDVGTWVRD